MSKSKKNKFADVIIICCIVICFIITASVIWEYHRLDTVIPSNVLGVILGLWGGELLIIALRQVFGSDIVTKTNKINYNSEDRSI